MGLPLPKHAMSQSEERNHLRSLLRRIHQLMDTYFDAMEASLQSKDYAFTQREQDARVFNALAHTLTRLTQLEKMIATEQTSYDQQSRILLEQRLAKLAQRAATSSFSQESQ